VSLEPAVAEALGLLRAEPDCWLARMSGSGATCFGVFTRPEAALAAAERLRAAARAGGSRPPGPGGEAS
jgi:4-diphosphocytidyl-2-C-methyl-D-erythritol kinase